jgi:hypothetical protein
MKAPTKNQQFSDFYKNKRLRTDEWLNIYIHTQADDIIQWVSVRHSKKHPRQFIASLTYPEQKAPTSIKALHKFVHKSLCLLLTYLAYMWMISSSGQIQDHPSKLCQVQQHNHQPACAADEVYWRNTAPLRPHPNITLQLINVSLSTYHLLPKIFSHGFSAALLPIFYSELHKGSLSDWWWVGHLSLSLSLSLSHTHRVNFFSSYEWMKPGKVSFIFAVPKVKSINTGI